MMITWNPGIKILPKIQHRQEGNGVLAYYIDDTGHEQHLSTIGYDNGSMYSIDEFNKQLGDLPA